MLADTAVLSRGGRTPTAADFAALAAEPRTVKLHQVSAGEAKKIVLGFQQSAPGFIVMFTLLVSFTAGGALLAAERRLGTLRRLASSPISRTAVVTGKFGSRFVLGLIQMSFAMLAAKWLLAVNWGGPRLWAVLMLLIVYTALCAALSVLLGSVVRSESQSIGLGVIASNILAALGGCWWPIEITPPAMQQFSLVMPTGWAMHGLHRLLNYGSSPVSVFPHVLALAAATLLAGWIAVRRFEFR